MINYIFIFIHLLTSCGTKYTGIHNYVIIIICNCYYFIFFICIHIWNVCWSCDFIVCVLRHVMAYYKPICACQNIIKHLHLQVSQQTATEALLFLGHVICTQIRLQSISTHKTPTMDEIISWSWMYVTQDIWTLNLQ